MEQKKEKWGSDQDEQARKSLTSEGYTVHNEPWTLLPEGEDHAELSETWGDLPHVDVLTLDHEKVDEKPTERQDIQPDDLLSVYLAEMSQEPLLTFEQEVELARQIERGQQARQMLQEADYAADERGQLQDLVEVGQAAREHLGRAEPIQAHPTHGRRPAAASAHGLGGLAALGGTPEQSRGLLRELGRCR